VLKVLKDLKDLRVTRAPQVPQVPQAHKVLQAHKALREQKEIRAIMVLRVKKAKVEPLHVVLLLKQAQFAALVDLKRMSQAMQDILLQVGLYSLLVSMIIMSLLGNNSNFILWQLLKLLLNRSIVQETAGTGSSSLWMRQII
jgi:hypothetical protein